MQDFAFTNAGEISFDDDLCLDVDSAAVPGDPVKIMGCNELGDSQKWEYSKQVGLQDFELDNTGVSIKWNTCTCFLG